MLELVREEYECGDVYCGEVRDVGSSKVKDGHGRYEFANGSVYDGEWRNGTMHGKGMFFENQTGDRFEGQWAFGRRVCGVYHYANGDLYLGAFDAVRGTMKHGRSVVVDDFTLYDTEYVDDRLVRKEPFSTALQQSSGGSPHRGGRDDVRYEEQSFTANHNKGPEKSRQETSVPRQHNGSSSKHHEDSARKHSMHQQDHPASSTAHREHNDVKRVTSSSFHPPQPHRSSQHLHHNNNPQRRLESDSDGDTTSIDDRKARVEAAKIVLKSSRMEVEERRKQSKLRRFGSAVLGDMDRFDSLPPRDTKEAFRFHFR